MKKIISILFTILCYPLSSFSQKHTDDGKIFTLSEQMPKFKGGQEAMVQYLKDNIKYPQDARKNNIQGTVYVTFIVDTVGNVNNVKLLRGIDKSCDEEAIRIVGLMPPWEPGIQEGKKVKVQFCLPINFTLGSKQSESSQLDPPPYLPPLIKQD